MKNEINPKCEDRKILEMIMDIHNQDTDEILIYLTMCKKVNSSQKRYIPMIQRMLEENQKLKHQIQQLMQELEKGKYFYWWYQYWF